MHLSVTLEPFDQFSKFKIQFPALLNHPKMPKAPADIVWQDKLDLPA